MGVMAHERLEQENPQILSEFQTSMEYRMSAYLKKIKNCRYLLYMVWFEICIHYRIGMVEVFNIHYVPNIS